MTNPTPAASGAAPAATPAAQWRASGELDPHAGRYDVERAELMLGELTDDELANGAFMNYDVRLSFDDMVNPKPGQYPPIAWMTAVKDRIRWLSRALEAALASPQVAPERQYSANELAAMLPANVTVDMVKQILRLATPVQVAPPSVMDELRGFVETWTLNKQECWEGNGPESVGDAFMVCISDIKWLIQRGEAEPAPVAPQDDARDAAKWRALPAYAERHKVNLVHLFRDIDDAMSLSTPAAKPTEEQGS